MNLTSTTIQQDLNYILQTYNISKNTEDTLRSYFSMPIINVEVEKEMHKNFYEGADLVAKLAEVYDRLSPIDKKVFNEYITFVLESDINGL